MPKPISTVITAHDLARAFALEIENWEAVFTDDQIDALLPRVSTIRVWLAMQLDMGSAMPVLENAEDELHPALFEAAFLCPVPKGKGILSLGRFEHELGRVMATKYAAAPKASELSEK